MVKRWQFDWTTSMNYEISRKFFPKVNRERQRQTRTKSRKNLQLLAQAATGHGLFAGQLSKWHDMPATCQLCESREAIETSWHIWHECEALEVEQLQRVAAQGPPEATEQSASDKQDQDQIIAYFRLDRIADLMERNSMTIETLKELRERESQ
ncbi:unnamed protein product [Paramuricea clavata]|uniref:Uncharacterized protein n=1 Tax=Paramuricea clavata TaxID=317549 RepID=A0A7D9KLP2_PARCT|nr:unnamed protein product [Paramuricea clavata]